MTHTSDTCARPKGFIRQMRAALCWTRDRSTVAMTARRTLTVHLRDIPTPLTRTITRSDQQDAMGRLAATDLIEDVLDAVLRKAGSSGMMIGQTFYPHSAIARIEVGPLEVFPADAETPSRPE